MRVDDYVLRAVEQIAQMVAKILALTKEGAVDEAEEQLEDAYKELLGNDLVFLRMVDSETLANLLGWPEKMVALARLSLAEARIATARGDTHRAQEARSRARALVMRARGVGVQERLLEGLDELE